MYKLQRPLQLLVIVVELFSCTILYQILFVLFCFVFFVFCFGGGGGGGLFERPEVLCYQAMLISYPPLEKRRRKVC